MSLVAGPDGEQAGSAGGHGASVWPYVLGQAPWILAYGVMGWVGGLTRVEPAAIALVWPAAGLGFLWVLHGRRLRRVPWAECVSLAATAAVANYATGAPLGLALALGIVNTLQAVVAVAMFRMVDDRGSRYLHDVQGLTAVVVGAVGGAACAALFAALAATAMRGLPYVPTAGEWVARNAVSMAVIAAVGLVDFRRGAWRSAGAEWIWWEGAAFAIATVVVYVLLFAPAAAAPFSFLVLLLPVWSGLRLGIQLTALHVVVGGTAAVVLTLYGLGPFGAVEPLFVRASAVQVFVGILATIGFGLATSQLERGRALAQTREGERLLRENMLSAPIGNAIVRLRGEDCADIVLANSALADLLDSDEEELLGTCLSEWVADYDAPRVDHLLRQMAAGDVDRWAGRVAHESSTGDVRMCQMSIVLLPERDGHALATLQLLDVTAREEMQTQLARMALHDPLTGLPNRSLLYDRVGQALAASSASGRRVALVYLNVDRLKGVNDAIGHEGGDRLLATMAERLARMLSPGDTLARVGGDEFVACCPDVADEAEAAEIADRLVASASEPVELAGRELSISVSGGVTLSCPTSEVASVLHEADLAMYEAKKSGGAGYEFYAEEFHVRAHRRTELELMLRHALEREQFALYYQPIVDIATETWTGVEALIRWQHPDLGLLAPDLWLDVAEQSGRMRAIGPWVIRQACSQAAAFDSGGRPGLVVHVNVSASQLSDPLFMASVTEALSQSGLSPDCLVLELTESHLLQISSDLLADLDDLRELGVKLAADDFGTGYSSLAQLVQLPVDCLKIDKSFVQAMSTDVRAHAVVHGIIGIAKAAGLSLIAEGVETEAAAVELLRLGCLSAQGYHYGRPTAPDAIAATLESLDAGGALAP